PQVNHRMRLARVSHPRTARPFSSGRLGEKARPQVGGLRRACLEPRGLRRMTSLQISIPELSLIVLIGASGSGKSSLARRLFKPTEILSSDTCRGWVS